MSSHSAEFHGGPLQIAYGPRRLRYSARKVTRRGFSKLLTIAEIVRLADAINPRDRALNQLAGTGGLRMGELGALRGRRIDSRRATVDVVENSLAKMTRDGRNAGSIKLSYETLANVLRGRRRRTDQALTVPPGRPTAL